MIARWPIHAVLAAALLLAVAACHNHPQPGPVPIPATQPERVTEAAPTTQPDTLSAPHMLARKTETYAQDVSALLDQRLRQKQQPQARRPASEPSEVTWADPKSLPTPPDPAADTTRAPARPIADSSVTANQIAAVTPVAPAVPPNLADANLPLPSARTVALADLEQKLAQRIKDNGRDIVAHLDYQLLQFVKDQSVPQLQTLAALPQEDREMLAALCDSLTNFRTSLRADSNMLLAGKVRPLIEMSDRLRAQADLLIPTVALCTRVDGFGVYEPIEPARFVAGKEHPIIIYCEVANFSSQQNDKNLWETTLRQQEVLYTEMGMHVWPEKPAEKVITDVSRNRRHDFFVVKLVKLPKTLTIGRYLLKVSIIDDKAARVAEATLPIQIVAQ